MFFWLLLCFVASVLHAQTARLATVKQAAIRKLRTGIRFQSRLYLSLMMPCRPTMTILLVATEMGRQAGGRRW